MSTTADMTDTELERHIQDCGRLMLAAMEAGNREEAEGWLQAQNQAIAQCSPAQVARMEAARGLGPSGQSCYFDSMGETHREQLPFFLRRQAA